MKRTPKDVIGFLYDPRKVFFHVMLILKNEPGAMADVAQKLATANISILSGFTSAEPDKPTGVWSFFAEAKNGKATIDAIQKIAKESKFTEQVAVNQSKSGLLVDSFHFPLQFTPGQRAILISPGVLRQMFDHIKKTFGSGGGVILYQAGYSVGLTGMEGLLKVMDRRVLEENAEDLVKLYTAVGWGEIEQTERSADSTWSRLKVYESFECVGASNKKPGGDFIRGVLAGAQTVMAGKEMKCEEVKCISVGDKHCEYVLQPA